MCKFLDTKSAMRSKEDITVMKSNERFLKEYTLMGWFRVGVDTMPVYHYYLICKGYDTKWS
jgi:hypothetical protein